VRTGGQITFNESGAINWSILFLLI
jgi:hypothetical protein